jgi:putative flippase GtrA
MKLQKQLTPEVVKQASRYLVVGFSSAAIELTLFVVLYNLLAIDIRISNVIALTCSTVFNFIMSYTWTFKASKNFKKSLVLYLLLFIFNQFFSTSIIYYLVELGLYSFIAKLFAMACIVCWNFVLYRKVVFV